MAMPNNMVSPYGMPPMTQPVVPMANWNIPTMMAMNNASQPVSVSPTSQSPQMGVLPGRIVNAPEEIKAFEVPIDSQVSVFPSSDGKSIYVKYWNENGGIDTKIYRLDEEKPQNKDSEKQEVTIQSLTEDIAYIKDELIRTRKLLQKRNYGNKPGQKMKQNNSEDS